MRLYQLDSEVQEIPGTDIYESRPPGSHVAHNPMCLALSYATRIFVEHEMIWTRSVNSLSGALHITFVQTISKANQSSQGYTSIFPRCSFAFLDQWFIKSSILLSMFGSKADMAAPLKPLCRSFFLCLWASGISCRPVLAKSLLKLDHTPAVKEAA
jgi:hypothetical protein